MPLLQGQPFRLIQPPEDAAPGEEIFTIQHTGEEFRSKSDYEDRLALYSQSIWTCQCSGKSGLTHQEAWTSEAKVRVLLNSSFPEPLLSPVLRAIHHSTMPLDQLVESASTLCYSHFHPEEELTLLGPQPIQVRVQRMREDPAPTIKTENGTRADITPTTPTTTTTTPALINGCNNTSPEGGIGGHLANGTVTPSVTSNGTSGQDEVTPPSAPGKGGAKEEGSPGRKRTAPVPLLQHLLYDVKVIGEERVITDVPASHLQRTYRVPPKEHFRLFVRANAIRQRSSAYTPWIVTEELVKRYAIPSKLASIFTNPKINPAGRKRKVDPAATEGTVKKLKAERMEVSLKESKIVPPPQPPPQQSPEQPVKKRPGRKPGSKNKPKDPNAMKRDPNTPRKKPGPKPGSKRTPRTPKETKSKVKIESDSDDNVSLAVLAGQGQRQVKVENGEGQLQPQKNTKDSARQNLSRKREIKMSQKMRQATLFDMRTPNKKPMSSSHSPRKSPHGRTPNPEIVMRTAIMKKMVHQYSTLKGLKGTGRKLVHTMDQVLKKLSLQQIEVITNLELRANILKRHERMLERRVLAKMTTQEKEDYMKQKAKEEAEKRQQTKDELNRKIEDKLLTDLKPLPAPLLVPTPEEIPNSLFGDITMIVEFVECYNEIVRTSTDNWIPISTSQLMEALAEGPMGFRYLAGMMCLLLHLVVADDRIGNMKELGVKVRSLPVHYQTAAELTRLCLSRRDFSDTASQHSDDNTEEGEEQNELSDGLMHKLETSELYELQPGEIIAVLKALCHSVNASDVAVDHVEEIEEKAYQLYKERAKIKKCNMKQEMERKKEQRQERLKKKMEKKSGVRKPPGRPKGYSPQKAPITIDSFYSKKEELDLSSPAQREKRKRLTPEEVLKEREKNKSQLKEKLQKEEEEERRQFVVTECERVMVQKDLLIRLQPLGQDRNHDRYWIFNNTTPGLYVEKGWVDHNTTYTTMGDSKDPAVCGDPLHESGSDSDDKPLSTIKEELTGTIKKESHLGRPKKQTVDEKTQTFAPVGQNLWFYYDNMEKVEELVEALAEKGHRESKLKGALSQVKEQLQVNMNTKWEPLNEHKLINGALQMAETLREDIIQIERELAEGWLGAVPDFEAWEAKALQSSTLQELGECLVEAQRNMHNKYLKGIMQPSKKMIPVPAAEGSEAPTEYEEMESTGTLQWREAVLNCQTFSRMHMLVGMFDSCIKWEKSIATKKCKVCRHQNMTTPLAICERCEVSYHWSCLRPPLKEDPVEPWLCTACRPKPSLQRERRKAQDEGDECGEKKEEKEKVCRVCLRGLGLIFCCLCPAAYHSECHNPPLQTRARKDWACVDCTNRTKKRGSRKVTSRSRQDLLEESPPQPTQPQPPPPPPPPRAPKQGETSPTSRSHTAASKTSSSRSSRRAKTKQVKFEVSRRSLRHVSRRKYVETDEEEEEEDDEEDGDGYGSSPSTSQRRSSRTSVKKKSYRIASDEEEGEEEEEGEGEEEKQEALEEEDIEMQEEEEETIEDEQEEEEEEEEKNENEGQNEMVDNENDEEMEEEDEEEDEGEEEEEEEEEEDNYGAAEEEEGHTLEEEEEEEEGENDNKETLDEEEEEEDNEEEEEEEEDNEEEEEEEQQE